VDRKAEKEVNKKDKEIALGLSLRKIK